MPQDADGVQKLLDSMLSGLWLAQASVCSSAQVAVAQARNSPLKPKPGVRPALAIEELSADELRLMSDAGLRRHTQAWALAGSEPGKLLRVNTTQVGLALALGHVMWLKSII
jgi:hypothetical protein